MAIEHCRNSNPKRLSYCIPYASCMVYLPTFGWFLRQMLEFIYQHHGSHVAIVQRSMSVHTNDLDSRGFQAPALAQVEWRRLVAQHEAWASTRRRASDWDILWFMWSSLWQWRLQFANFLRHGPVERNRLFSHENCMVDLSSSLTVSHYQRVTSYNQRQSDLGFFKYPLVMSTVCYWTLP